MAGVRNIFATKEQLEEKYAEMNSMNKLAKYYGVNVKTVTSLMNYYNIKRNVDSQGARKHFYDESYFEVIDTEDKPYFGWCYRERTPSNISPKVKTGVRYDSHYAVMKALDLGTKFKKSS